MKADQFQAKRCAKAQFEAQMVVINKIIEDMNMNAKKFPLSMDEICELLIHYGCYVYKSQPFSDFRIEGKFESIIGALQVIVDKCSEAQASIDSAKDQEIADLKRQLAAAQNDVKQLRQSRDKRNGKSASIADLGVNISIDSRKSSQMLDFLDELAECAKAMEQAAGEATKALNRMAENTELIKVESPSVGSKSHPPASNGIATYPKGVWIDWHGGNEAPIPDGVSHKVKFRDGSVSSIEEKASTWHWGAIAEAKFHKAIITAFMIL